LKKAAKELNEKLGLEPPILMGLSVPVMKKKVKEAASLINAEEDEFSEGTWDVLEELGAGSRPSGVEEPEAEEPEVEAAVEDAMDETLLEDFNAARSLVALKGMCAEWDVFADIDVDDKEFTGLQGPKKLKAAMLELLPEDLKSQLAPKPTAKKKTTTAAASMSRIEAAVAALAGMDAEPESVVISELANEADATYTDAGGASNLKESTWASKMVVNVLTAAKKHGIY